MSISTKIRLYIDISLKLNENEWKFKTPIPTQKLYKESYFIFFEIPIDHKKTRIDPIL
jgi:hypothetical protein